MRVVVNGLAALKPKTGVGHHVAELAAALARDFPADGFTLYPGDLLSGVGRRVNRAPQGSGTPGRRGWRAKFFGAAKSAGKAATAWHFAAFTRASRFDLYHEPNFVPFPSRLPTVLTVHDLSVLKYPQWHPADRVRMHEKHFRRGLGRADHVIVVSEAVRSEVVGELWFPPDKVTAVPNGVGPAFRPLPAEAVEPVRRRYGLPDRFFLCVGTIEPRKNLGTAMRAFADLPAKARSECPLVLAGPWGWRSDADREFFDTAAAPAGARHLGYVPDADLPALYNAALGLVYPSHYEGFGLPPLEMLACGGAVLASTAAAVREVCGRHAASIDPDDVAGWRDALHRLATDSDYRSVLAAGGVEHAARFTWSRAAAETMAVYRRVLGLSS
jgi:alpha-1,3-rhamnosyl/mannosyltransferase